MFQYLTIEHVTVCCDTLYPVMINIYIINNISLHQCCIMGGDSVLVRHVYTLVFAIRKKSSLLCASRFWLQLEDL